MAGWIDDLERAMRPPIVGKSKIPPEWNRSATANRVWAVLKAAQRLGAIYEDLERYEGQRDHGDEEWAALGALAKALEAE